MRPTRLTIRPSANGRFVLYRGTSRVTSFASHVNATIHVERQYAEDCEWRLRQVQDYLTARSLRPAPVPVEDRQLELPLTTG